jgi:hypothetical protein
VVPPRAMALPPTPPSNSSNIGPPPLGELSSGERQMVLQIWGSDNGEWAPPPPRSDQSVQFRFTPGDSASPVPITSIVSIAPPAAGRVLTPVLEEAGPHALPRHHKLVDWHTDNKDFNLEKALRVRGSWPEEHHLSGIGVVVVAMAAVQSHGSFDVAKQVRGQRLAVLPRTQEIANLLRKANGGDEKERADATAKLDAAALGDEAVRVCPARHRPLDEPAAIDVAMGDVTLADFGDAVHGVIFDSSCSQPVDHKAEPCCRHPDE